MCLDTLEDFPVKDCGWKVFIRCRDKLGGPFRNYVFPVNKWLDANNGKGNTVLSTNDEDKKYKAGFHIYASREAARESGYNVVKRVKFKEVIATGRQNGHKVIVAKKVLVMPVKKRS